MLLRWQVLRVRPDGFGGAEFELSERLLNGQTFTTVVGLMDTHMQGVVDMATRGGLPLLDIMTCLQKNMASGIEEAGLTHQRRSTFYDGTWSHD